MSLPIARTYRLQPSTVALLDATCARLGVYQSDLLELLLLDGLRKVASGEIELKRTPVKFRISM